jgi:hypothetical protein
MYGALPVWSSKRSLRSTPQTYVECKWMQGESNERANEGSAGGGTSYSCELVNPTSQSDSCSNGIQTAGLLNRNRCTACASEI